MLCLGFFPPLNQRSSKSFLTFLQPNEEVRLITMTAARRHVMVYPMFPLKHIRQNMSQVLYGVKLFTEFETRFHFPLPVTRLFS